MEKSAAQAETDTLPTRMLTLTVTEGDGISLHVNEAGKKHVAHIVGRNVLSALSRGAAFLSALAESPQAGGVKAAVMEAARKAFFTSGEADDEACIEGHEETLKEREKALVAMEAQAAAGDPSALPEDLAVIRADVDYLRAKIAQLKAADIRNRERKAEATISVYEESVAILLADIENAESASKEDERRSPEQLARMRAEVAYRQAQINELKAAA